MKKRIWMALAAAGCVMMAPMTVMGGEEAGISGDIYSFQMDYDGEIFSAPNGIFGTDGKRLAIEQIR